MNRRALVLTISFVVWSLITVLGAFFIQRSLQSIQKEGDVLISIARNARLAVSQSSLEMIKYLTGDTNVKTERQVEALQSVKNSLEAAYNNAHPDGNVERFLSDPAKLAIRQGTFGIDKIAQTNQAAEAITQARRAPVDSSATISAPVAVPFANEPYAEFDNTMSSLETAVQAAQREDVSTYTFFGLLFALFQLGTIGVAGYWFWLLQAKSDRMNQEQQTRLEETGQATATLSQFIEAISAGNYTAELDWANGSSNLSDALYNMRNKLRENAEEDSKRNWSTSGLAKIGEILRVGTASKTELYDGIIKFVVKYTKSNQGGLFILNDENTSEHFLELAACYAYERKKYLTKRIVPGEGMVGQCYLEGERIYLREVPAEYVNITSGLGGSIPSALLIVPLKVNDQLFGVMELASFNPYEPHEIELVEKFAQSIASTISTVSVTDSTRVLLEKTQQQAEEMRAQEEEMRQNMEELEATQEEMRRKEKHIQSLLDGEKQRNENSLKNRQVVMELSKVRDIQNGNWTEALEKMTSTIGKHLKVSRTAVWHYQLTEDNLRCEMMYAHTTGDFQSGQELASRMYADYFAALTSEQTIIAPSVSEHPATRSLATEVYQTANVQSVLYVPYFVDGRVAGLIGCEQQFEQREWTDEDVDFLKSCADLLSVTYNTHRINISLHQLNDDQETLQTIIDNIPRAVFWKDKELRFQGCNKLFASNAGLMSHKDIIGKTDFEMPWKEHGEAYRNDDVSVMNSRRARLDLEERNVNSNGVESWVLTSKVPVLNRDGEVVAVLGMFEDITERKRKETLMQANMEELEELRRLAAKRAS